MLASQHVYDEAVLAPHLRLRIPEPDLLQGAVEKITIPTVSGSYQRPWGQNGAFAIAYKFTTHSGKTKALRCFRVAMPADIQERYEALSAFLEAHLPESTVQFCYYEDGIIIEESVQGSMQRVSHAVMVMDWQAGETLLDTVHRLCQTQDKDGLALLAQQWLSLQDRMQRAHLAHGDLSGRNVLVRDDGSLVLIDYDGCYIPQFELKPPLVSGQPDYQHPHLARRAFNEEMDHFSAYAIYLALRALQFDPDLWETYGPQDSQGSITEDRLLFAQKDFLKPDSSLLFCELERNHDPVLYALTYLLKWACQRPIEQMLLPPLSTSFVDRLQAHAPLWGEASAVERQRANVMRSLRPDLLAQALHHRCIKEVIRLAQQIEAENGLLPEEVRSQVWKVRQQFLASQHPILGKVIWHAQASEVSIEWQWPDEPLIQWAAVAWRTDRWPSNLHEPGTYLYHPVARESRPNGSFCFSAPHQRRIWLQLYFALPEACPGRTLPGITWCYSESGSISARFLIEEDLGEISGSLGQVK